MINKQCQNCNKPMNGGVYKQPNKCPHCFTIQEGQKPALRKRKQAQKAPEAVVEMAQAAPSLEITQPVPAIAEFEIEESLDIVTAENVVSEESFSAIDNDLAIEDEVQAASENAIFAESPDLDLDELIDEDEEELIIPSLEEAEPDWSKLSTPSAEEEERFQDEEVENQFEVIAEAAEQDDSGFEPRRTEIELDDFTLVLPSENKTTENTADTVNKMDNVLPLEPKTAKTKESVQKVERVVQRLKETPKLQDSPKIKAVAPQKPSTPTVTNEAIPSEEQAREQAKIAAAKKRKMEADRLRFEKAQALAKKQAELKAKQEAELKAKQEAELKAKQEAELKAKQEAELKAKQEAELKAKQEAELKAKQEAELRAQQESELKAKFETELKAKHEAELRANEEAQQKAKLEAELNARIEAEHTAKQEAELRANQEAEAKAKLEADFNAKLEAEHKAKQDVELKAKQEAELKAKREAELKAKLDAELKAKQDVELKAEQQAQLIAQQEAKLAELEASIANPTPEPTQIAASKAGAQRIMLTTETNPNVEIEKRLDIVSAECIFGLNIVQDFYSRDGDFKGGRSPATQKAIKDARKETLKEIRQEAIDLGANAVIGINFTYTNEVSGGGKSMIMIVASGTAVTIEE